MPQLDFFVLSIEEVQGLLHVCHDLELLKVLINAPMEKLVRQSRHSVLS